MTHHWMLQGISNTSLVLIYKSNKINLTLFMALSAKSQEVTAALYLNSEHTVHDEDSLLLIFHSCQAYVFVRQDEILW
jgi:hypothetical protein